MGLLFVFGSCGSGKSRYVCDMAIRESCAFPDKNIIFLVPEQFTVQAEKDLCALHPAGGLINIQVLSFARLAFRVFAEVGVFKRTILDDEGKNLIIRKVAGKYENELSVLKGNLKKQGYISEVKAVISEFKQYAVSIKDLDGYLASLDEDSFFCRKLKDIRTVYAGFEEFMEDRYMTNEDIFDVLASAIPKSKFLKGCVVIMDGFTGFTPVQDRVIEELLATSEKLVMTVLMGKKEDPFKYESPYRLFAMGKQTVAHIAKAAARRGVKIEEPVRTADRMKSRFAGNDALAFLESELFRYSGRRFKESLDAVRIYVASDPQKESEFVASEIKRLVRTKKMRYRDIGVIAADMESYGAHLKKSLEDLNIPVFVDRKKSIMHNAFVEYIRSLLSMADMGFSYESVFRFLRTGMTGFTTNETDALENYVLASGIRGFKKWQEPWDSVTKEADGEKLKALNILRERFAESLKDLMAVLSRRSKTVRDMTDALYTFLFKEECQQRIMELKEGFRSRGQFAAEKEYSQIYRIVMELFDKLISLLGEEKVTVREYCDLLDAGFEEAKVGVIPVSLDEVTVGDMLRTRFVDIKALFLVGANDSNLPGNLRQGGLLTQQDRERLGESNLRLSPGTKEKAYIQKLYLYTKLSKPTGYLYVSYSKTSSDGKSIRPSYLINELKRLYPDIEVTDADALPLSERELTRKSVEEFLAKGLRGKEFGLSEQWKQIYSYVYAEERQKAAALVDAAFYKKEKELLSAEEADALFRDAKVFSVTRLEKFAACAYAHFLDYGLRLSERQIYGFEPVDFGNIAHRTMELFSKKADGICDSWDQLSEEALFGLSDECVDKSVQEYGNTALFCSVRDLYRLSRIKKIMRRTVWALSKQLGKGDFKAAGYELSFGSGKIDRVDTYEEGDAVYVKVTDYKTGIKEFDLTALYHGIQLQLPVYMKAAMQIEQKAFPGKTVKPGGIFYYHIKDPIVDRPEKEEDTDKKILEELRLEGLVSAENTVIDHLDREIGVGRSLCIPVTKKKDGSVHKNSGTIDEEDFEVMLSYTMGKAAELKGRIASGEADAFPYRMRKETGCDFCQYKDICRFDPETPGCEYRAVYKMSDAEVIEKMKDDIEKERGTGWA